MDGDAANRKNRCSHRNSATGIHRHERQQTKIVRDHEQGSVWASTYLSFCDLDISPSLVPSPEGVSLVKAVLLSGKGLG